MISRYFRFFIILILFSSSFYACSSARFAAGGRAYDKRDSSADYRSKYEEKKKAEGLLADESEENASDKDTPGSETEKHKERMVIYVANYTINVESVKQSMQRINTIVTQFNGFIESSVTSASYQKARIVLRVPVKSFESALKSVESLGYITGKEVKASDVTMEYNDISLRMETAKKVRERMYELLKRVKKVKERVKILREIERLTTVIDSLTARMTFLKNRADFSTIIIVLNAKVKEVVRKFIPSPFPWIAKLDPYNRSIYDEGKDLTFQNPSGYFNLKEEFYKDKTGKFLFVTPDQSNGIRIGVVENYPPADIKFWTEAFNIDLANRMYKINSSEDVSGKNSLLFKKFTINLSSGDIYIIAFAVKGDKVLVVEAKYTDEKIFKNNIMILNEFIKSIGLEQ